eukprot:407736-Prymnesium_polylepis.1
MPIIHERRGHPGTVRSEGRRSVTSEPAGARVRSVQSLRVQPRAQRAAAQRDNEGRPPRRTVT